VVVGDSRGGIEEDPRPVLGAALIVAAVGGDMREGALSEEVRLPPALLSSSPLGLGPSEPTPASQRNRRRRIIATTTQVPTPHFRRRSEPGARCMADSGVVVYCLARRKRLAPR